MSSKDIIQTNAISFSLPPAKIMFLLLWRRVECWMKMNFPVEVDVWTVVWHYTTADWFWCNRYSESQSWPNIEQTHVMQKEMAYDITVMMTTIQEANYYFFFSFIYSSIIPEDRSKPGGCRQLTWSSFLYSLPSVLRITIRQHDNHS